MDTLSHGLWGGVGFGRKNKKSFWLAFTFGITPDLFSFGLLFIARFLGFYPGLELRGGPSDPSMIPAYVDKLYNITHSLVIFIIVFGLTWLYLKRPVLEMGAWAIHVILDIFTHGFEFFPTPFLWPLSDYKFDGVPWGNPWIFFPNVILLILAYAYFFWRKRYKRIVA